MTTHSLERLLEVRRAQEQARRRDLAAALAASASQQRKVEGLRAEGARARQVRRAVLERATFVEELLRAQRWLDAVDRRVEDELAELARLKQCEEACRGALLAAMRDVRVLERLLERRAEHRRREAV